MNSKERRSRTRWRSSNNPMPTDLALSRLSREDAQPKSRCEIHQMSQWGRLSLYHLACYRGMGLIIVCWQEHFGIVQDLLWDVSRKGQSGGKGRTEVGQ